MTKKKIIAIILFLFLSLFMFTFANPGDIEPELKKPEKTKEETKKEEVKEDNEEKEETTQTVVNTNNNSSNETNKKHLEAPIIEVPEGALVILLGENYDVMEGVKVISEENLTASADIKDTSKLPEGTHTITYTVTDSEGNSATATREVVVLDPNKDQDKDGFTNGEEIIEGTDPLDKESFPTTLVVNPKEVKIIVGTDYDVMTGVEALGDKNNKNLKITSSITDTKELVVGEYTIKYETTDNYGKNLSDERSLIVASDVNGNGVADDEETYKLTVSYIMEDQTEAPAAHEEMVLQGEQYNVVSPRVRYYVPSKEEVSGTMPEEDYSETVTYYVDANEDGIADKDQRKLTVTYVTEDGKNTPAQYEEYYLIGEGYSVPSPTVTGYVIEKGKETISGTINNVDVTEVVNYYLDANGDGIADKDQRKLTITYVTEDGNNTPAKHEEYYLIGENYSVPSPTVTGYVVEEGKETISGTMKNTDVTETVNYYLDTNNDGVADKDQGKLTITFITEDGKNTPDQYEKYYLIGENYSVPVDKLDGYVADKETVSGNMVKGGVNETVNYYLDTNNDGVADKDQMYTLTVTYVMSDQTEAPASHTESILEGESYSVESPTVTGYVADKTTVSGNMVKGGVSETVTYYLDTNNDGVADKDQRKLTITYATEDGNNTPDQFERYYLINEDYSVESPTVTGYVVEEGKETVSGTMGTEDVATRVMYYLDTNNDGTADKDQMHTVRFYNYENTMISEQSVLEGNSAVEPEVPEIIDGLSFTGWDTEAYKNVTGPVETPIEVHALYSDVEPPRITLDVTGEGSSKFINATVTDNVGVSVVKILSGNQPASAFENNGTVLTGVDNVYSYETFENDIYTVYAKDVNGNEHVEDITVNGIEEKEIELDFADKYSTVIIPRAEWTWFLDYWTRDVNITSKDGSKIVEVRYYISDSYVSKSSFETDASFGKKVSGEYPTESVSFEIEDHWLNRITVYVKYEKDGITDSRVYKTRLSNWFDDGD